MKDKNKNKSNELIKFRFDLDNYKQKSSELARFRFNIVPKDNKKRMKQKDASYLWYLQ